MTDPRQRPLEAEREQKYADFVGLLARHDLAIRRFVRSLLPAPEGVDDVVQETALECWKKFDEFEPQHQETAADEFIRWACVIARFKAMSWQRDRARDRLVFRESVIEKLAHDAMAASDHVNERAAVEGCLAKLDSDSRQLVLSVHTPGESISRIADRTGVKARRLYSRVNALRRKLQECVRQQLATEVSHG